MAVGSVHGHVLRAELRLAHGADERAVGAAVTAALCGHWEHEGPCRWPHHSAIDTAAAPAAFRTVFACSPADLDEVHGRIVAALAGGDWQVVSCRLGTLAPDEIDLADRLAAGPRLAS